MFAISLSNTKSFKSKESTIIQTSFWTLFSWFITFRKILRQISYLVFILGRCIFAVLETHKNKLHGYKCFKLLLGKWRSLRIKLKLVSELVRLFVFAVFQWFNIQCFHNLIIINKTFSQYTRMPTRTCQVLCLTSL